MNIKQFFISIVDKKRLPETKFSFLLIVLLIIFAITAIKLANALADDDEQYLMSAVFMIALIEAAVIGSIYIYLSDRASAEK
jgi:integral membrane sensor domain MASE1